MKGTYVTKVKLVVVVKLFFWRKGLAKEAKMFETSNLDSYFASL